MKKFLIIFAVMVVAIQLIRPELNLGVTGGPKSFEKTVPVPGPVLSVLKRACYDCHSNRTVYPWYANIQPLGWWLAHHVDEGKEELNFDEFATYPSEKAMHKLDETSEVIKDGEMPLSSYLIIHSDAKLSRADVSMVSGWISRYQKSRK